jgi:hypothetical protein
MIEAVELDAWATEQEIAAVEAAFARAGFEVKAEPVIEASSADATWIVLVKIGVPALTFTRAFLSGVGSAGGRDAYGAARRWVQEVWEARDARPNAGGSLNVRDPEGTRIVLSPPLSEEALEALADIDWASVRGSDIFWDTKAQAWQVPGSGTAS